MQEYEMTEAELTTLEQACRPVPYMVVGGVVPKSPQENANAAWQRLAQKHGFVWDTVKPIQGMCNRHFTATPKE